MSLSQRCLSWDTLLGTKPGDSASKGGLRVGEGWQDIVTETHKLLPQKGKTEP